MTRAPLYVLGAGGHGKVIAESARREGVHELRGFLDDDPGRRESRPLGLRVHGGLEAIRGLEPGAWLALGVGSNAARWAACARAAALGIPLATVVDPSALVASGVVLGEGSYLAPRAVVHVDARLGAACIVNTGAVVEHDCVLEDAVHVSPGAVLGGEVRLGRGAHVGLGAVVLPGLEVGDWSVVGGGSVVTRSLPANVTAWGAPARVVRAAPGGPEA
jgi:acetyltransferase EpsM